RLPPVRHRRLPTRGGPSTIGPCAPHRHTPCPRARYLHLRRKIWPSKPATLRGNIGPPRWARRSPYVAKRVPRAFVLLFFLYKISGSRFCFKTFDRDWLFRFLT